MLGWAQVHLYLPFCGTLNMLQAFASNCLALGVCINKYMSRFRSWSNKYSACYKNWTYKYPSVPGIEICLSHVDRNVLSSQGLVSYPFEKYSVVSELVLVSLRNILSYQGLVSSFWRIPLYRGLVWFLQNISYRIRALVLSFCETSCRIRA